MRQTSVPARQHSDPERDPKSQQGRAYTPELTYFGGLNIEETAEALELSLAKVMVDCSMDRAWFGREIVKEDLPSDDA